MIIQYDNPDLEKICNDEYVATGAIGKFNAKKLKRVMTYLSGAINFKQIKTDRLYGFHGLKGDRYGQYAMDLHGADRITFYFLNDEEIIVIEDNEATIVKIDDITDYHK